MVKPEGALCAPPRGWEFSFGGFILSSATPCACFNEDRPLFLFGALKIRTGLIAGILELISLT